MACDAQTFHEHGFAGPYVLADQGPVDRLDEFVRHHRQRGRLNWALSKFGLTRNLRLDQRHGHIAFRPVYELATRPQVLDHVEALLGPDLLLWKGRIVVRASGDLGQGWHVDRDNMLLKGVHVSIAVTGMTTKNGCLQFIPGTHNYSVSLQDSFRRGDCDRFDSNNLLALADRMHPENAPHQVVTMELKPGEYFVTKGGLWHGVLPNTTEETRVAVVARYMRPDVQSHHWSHDDSAVKVISRKSLPCILVRGVDNHGLNDLYPPPGNQT